MDSFQEDNTWYVNYEDLNEFLGSFYIKDDTLFYEIDIATIKMLPNETYILADSKSAPIDITRIDRDRKIYVPIEKLLNNVVNVNIMKTKLF